MEINVLNTAGVEIFSGDAEEFLFAMDCDSELETALNQLEQSAEDEIVFSLDGSVFWTIERVTNCIY